MFDIVCELILQLVLYACIDHDSIIDIAINYEFQL